MTCHCEEDEADIQLSHNQSPVLKWSTQNHASRIKKAAATISGWDCSLLTFIYLGFDGGSADFMLSKCLGLAAKVL